uniref:Uncharacterized protein n=1 Tax=Pyrodinium bahamense TaxID=73915 RepID=A0A7S0FIY3_9DINO
MAWDSGRPCGALGLNDCHLGFHWLSDQTESGPSAHFSTVGRLAYSTVAPLCVRLQQTAEPGQFASEVTVQYWTNSSGGWQDHTSFSGLTGGVSQLRLPSVPLP